MYYLIMWKYEYCSYISIYGSTELEKAEDRGKNWNGKIVHQTENTVLLKRELSTFEENMVQSGSASSLKERNVAEKECWEPAKRRI